MPFIVDSEFASLAVLVIGLVHGACLYLLARVLGVPNTYKHTKTWFYEDQILGESVEMRNVEKRLLAPRYAVGGFLVGMGVAGMFFGTNIGPTPTVWPRYLGLLFCFGWYAYLLKSAWADRVPRISDLDKDPANECPR